MAAQSEEIYRSPAGVVWWRAEGFLHIRPSEGYEATAADATEMDASVGRFLGDRRVLFLIDRSTSYSPSFEALQILASSLSRYARAVAYYAPTTAARIASQTVIRTILAGEVGPIEIFDSEADAVRWLLAHGASSSA